VKLLAPFVAISVHSRFFPDKVEELGER
jgi:hypothetical protein